MDIIKMHIIKMQRININSIQETAQLLTKCYGIWIEMFDIMYEVYHGMDVILILI